METDCIMAELATSRFVENYLRKHNRHWEEDDIRDKAQDIYLILLRKPSAVLEAYNGNGMDGVRRYASAVAARHTRLPNAMKRERSHKAHIIVDSTRDGVAEDDGYGMVQDVERLLAGDDLVLWDLMRLHDFDLIAVAKECGWRLDETRWWWEGITKKIKTHLQN